jgi:Protein of unknown function (Hypoth_ymh)
MRTLRLNESAAIRKAAAVPTPAIQSASDPGTSSKGDNAVVTRSGYWVPATPKEEFVFGRVALLDVGALRHSCLVDDEWAIGILEFWIATASKAVHPGYPSGEHDGPLVGELREHEYQTAEVIARALGRPAIPLLILATSRATVLNFGDGIALAQQALGRIKTRADSRAHMGSTAPVMAADGLHPIIWDGAKGLWNDGHHRAAVQQAAALLNVHVQGRVQRYDVADVVLMQQTFSPNPPESDKPRLRWPGDDDDLTVKAMRSGILMFAQGAFSAIRNPAAHGTEDLPKQIALEHLATLSTLARWIDGCEIVKAESWNPPPLGELPPFREKKR